MFCISINHKNTPAEVRERFAFTTKGQRQFTQRLCAGVGGCVVLSTCNRMEIYFPEENEAGGENSRDVRVQVEHMLAEDRGVPVNLIRKYSMNYEGIQSVAHLCRVTCGMDSMVLGEVEIIHQVKSAYLMAQELGACCGELNIAFQGALATAKAVASESNTTKLPVSVGTLSAREAASFIGSAGGHVLVVGATGRIGSIVVKDIADLAPSIEIIGTSRRHHSAEEIFGGYPQIRIEDYDRRYELAAWADVIVSATASPHYTFVSDAVETAIRIHPKKRLFLDLAMPKDMDPDIAAIEGCDLRDIDYIRTLARENNESRARTITEMEPWLETQVEEIMKNIAFSRFNKEHGDVMDRLRTVDGARMVYRLKGQLEYQAFAKVLESIAAQESQDFEV